MLERVSDSFGSPRCSQQQGSTYIEPPQDCYSRWCIFSGEHSNACSSCWITCKQTYSKTREIRGGSPSYVCDMCISSPQ
ncbi:hypothetical protein CY34DRAFT_144780 [Suillus luteus UH-Slu-Lm8-n1]|uniref:Uncharacterized protein n=1 Tax=Suillus luteus UH-Slu-Lm8-n1 TaxID=930992 RepID=A0A0C9ZXH6_9AGAM|nr:hypothetical protein CY34DRAFT_144780 [Suillus luteus UH-Slu-Lm8-n1]